MADIFEILYNVGQDPWTITFLFFKYGGWLFLLVYLGFKYQEMEKEKHEAEKEAKIEYSLLAIDIPRNNIQKLSAVEQIFVTLSSISKLRISFEIISIEGFIQFLVRTPKQVRTQVEAAFFAQYPDAEISEVRDYMTDVPENIHELDSHYGIWGCDFVLEKVDYIPLKTFEAYDFEPMSSLLEVMANIKKGEMVSIQFVVSSISSSWYEKGIKYAASLTDKKGSTASPDHSGDKFVDWSMKKIDEMSEWLLPLGGEVDAKTKKADEKSEVSPEKKEDAASVQKKISKYAFSSKLRILYIAHKSVYDKERGVTALIGSINQFNSKIRLNSLIPSDKYITDKVDAYFQLPEKISAKTGSFIHAFRERNFHGAKPFALNTAELATLYHFPALNIKSALIKTVDTTKSTAPTVLPQGELDFLENGDTLILDPSVTHGIESVNINSIDNHLYEERYSLKKESPGLPSDTQHISDFVTKDNLSDIISSSDASTNATILPQPHVEIENIPSTNGVEQTTSDTNVVYNPDDLFNLKNK